MKKTLLLLPLLVLLLQVVSSSVQAQTEKGNMMVGMQVANIGGTFQDGGNTFNLNLTPSAAYFVRNNLAIGGMLDLGLATQNKLTTFSYGIGPWARYYFTTPQEMDFSSHAAFFIDGFVGLQGVSHENGGNTNGLGIKVGPGISYFISSMVSLDASVNYNLILGFGNTATVNKIGLNIGFQVFLPAFSLKEKFQNEGF
ncbi:MAG TPA: outer membrane beta-barrel protein [Chitinophagaceae bacterium]|nr:outer membrane beta-barrel protein [Chitinophagaceae bacterium]